MMAKITKGSSHAGTVNYAMRDDKGAELIDSNGVLTLDQKSIIESFRLQCQMRPDVMVVVGHISLNFSAEDSKRITNELMVQIAQDYMKRMGIKDTQYILVRHHDREHPHCHLVFNRIANDGKMISDRNDRRRSVKICRELTEKYGLHIAKGKEKVKRERLKEPDATRYRIYDALMEAMKTCTSWKQLQRCMEAKGIETVFVYKGKTSTIQGVVFGMNGLRYKGSQIDRRCSYTKISTTLGKNAKIMNNGIGREGLSMLNSSTKAVYKVASATTRAVFSLARTSVSEASKVVAAISSPTPSGGIAIGGSGSSGLELDDEEYIDENGVRRKKRKGLHR